MRMVIPVVMASMLLSGCEKENKRLTAEPVQNTDQRKTRSNISPSPDRPKKPSLDQPGEHKKQTDTARDRDSRIESEQAQQTAPRHSPTDAATEKSLPQKQTEQTAAVPSKQSGLDPRKHADSVTPLDQSGSETDVAITQRIRQALLREDLSFAAKNVLVITEADHVVLKGQVRSPSEAERIKAIAGTMTTKRIEDVLEVKP
jgi:osmotically-inducible protein OsmY